MMKMTSNADELARRLETARLIIQKYSDIQQPDTQPSSSLYGDDNKAHPYLMSTAAWFGIVSAIDHLASLVNLVEEESLPGPLTTLTLGRSSGLASAQTIWLLSPQRRDERLRRLGIIEREDRVQQRQYINDIAPTNLLDQMGNQQLIDDRRKKVEKLKELEKEVIDRVGKTKINATEIFKEAATFVSKNSDDADDLLISAGVMRQWRAGGGAAHARQWLLHTEPHNDYEHTISTTRRALTSDRDTVALPVLTATLLLIKARELYDLRNQSLYG